MKLLILFICLFFSFFGSVIAFKLLEFGLKTSDKILARMGKLLMWDQRGHLNENLRF